MAAERIYYPQNGEFVNLYVLKRNGNAEAIFLNKTQAEAAQRAFQESDPNDFWDIQHAVTEPCDNTC